MIFGIDHVAERLQLRVNIFSVLGLRWYLFLVEEF